MSNEELILKLVKLQGSYFKIGVQQGEELLTSVASENQEMLKKMTAHSKYEKSEKWLEQISPSILEEIKGLAKGARMNIPNAIRLYSGYDMEFLTMGCTSFVSNGMYVRNYDFSPDFYDSRLVFMKPKDGYASVGFSQQIIGRLDGMNEKGLVVGLHFVNNEERKEGFMATTIVRILLDNCKNVEEAIELIEKIPHAYCYNYSMTDSSGKGVVVEAASNNIHINIDKQITCTNHFEAHRLKEKNRKDIQSSILRKTYLNELLTKALSKNQLYHQFNDGKSPLFFNYYKQYFGTLHTVIYSPQDLSITFGVGENCKPYTVKLLDFINQNISLPSSIRGEIRQQ